MSHIHTSFTNIQTKFGRNIFNYTPDEQRCEIVKVLDKFIAVPLVLMEPDNQRKLLYGKAGAFRPKPYGLEYRVPSSFILQSDELLKWIFEATVNAFEFIKVHGFLPKELSAKIRNIVDNNDRIEADKFVKEFSLKLA